MKPNKFFLNIEPMTPDDIPASIEVDRAAYAANFSPRNYSDELENNRLAHYFVVRRVSTASTPEQNDSNRGVVGVGGFWLIAGELHVITIALLPDYRGLGLGEWLLLNLIEEGKKVGAEVATLEVRVSNQAAMTLYQKYLFREVGRRPGYYTNNGEDALILTTPLLHSTEYQAMLGKRKADLWERLRQLKDR